MLLSSQTISDLQYSWVGYLKCVVNAFLQKRGNVAETTRVCKKARNEQVKYNNLSTPTHKIVVTNNLLSVKNSWLS